MNAATKTDVGLLFCASMVRSTRAGRKTVTRRLAAAGATLARCPYGQPGGTLWMREAWRTLLELDRVPPRDLPADAPLRFEADDGAVPWLGERRGELGKLRPGMFLPRRFCRGELELVSRRLEWLHEITEADAIAEGIVRHDDGWWSGGDGLPTGNTARAGYRLLWDHLNGAESWPANPFVWRLEFRPAVFR